MNRTRTWARLAGRLVLLVALASLAPALPVWAAPPGNDAFAGAQALAGLLPLNAAGTNAEATRETGEPDHARRPGVASVWFSWTPLASQTVVIDTCASSFDTLLGVYTGDAVAALTVVGGNDDGCSNRSRVGLAAVAGQTYRIAVDGADGAVGTIALTIAANSPPANDDFAAAQPVGGPLPLSTTGTNTGATEELGEPEHGGQPGWRSVWYRWVPETSGPVIVETCAPTGFDTLLGVYTGSAVDALATIGGSDDACGVRSRVAFTAAAGETYQIAVDGYVSSSGTITLTIRSADAPANDAFAAAQPITGALPLSVTGTNVEATREAGEPQHGGNPGGASAWFSWVAETTGPVAIDTCASAFNTLLGVYTGDAVNALTAVAGNDNTPDCGTGIHSKVTFLAVAAQTYRIAIDGSDGRSGAIGFTLRPANPPPNDHLANAHVLTGALPQSVNGTNVEASKEPGEPNHAGQPGGSSVWYRWTPEVSGTVGIDTCDSDFATVLAVYIGDTVDALTHIASNDNTPECGSVGNASRVVIAVSAGQPYQIAVDGTGGVARNIALFIRAYDPPANDAFADAEVLSGTLPITVIGTNTDATEEPSEPDHDGNVGGASVWYRWTPATTGYVVMDTCATWYDSIVAVYTGDSLGALTQVASNDNDPDSCGNGYQSVLAFTAQAGVTYQIAVDGSDAAMGPIELSIREATAPDPPPNDHFADAQVLDGAPPISVTGTNVDATIEHDEQFVAGDTARHSVWYRWTAATSGAVLVETCGSDFDTLLEVATGTAIRTLVTVAENDDTPGCGTGSQSRVTFSASAGVTYRIAVDGYRGDTGAIVLELAPLEPPANDAFSAAQELGDAPPLVVDGTNVGATREPGEPNHGGNAGGASVWYRWTADADGPVVVDTCAAGVGLLAVYTGTAVSALTTVGVADQEECGSNQGRRFTATAGQTYLIAVDGFHGRQGPITLTLRRPPANDDFAAAQELPGTLPLSMTASNLGATEEPGEPDHVPFTRASVWYRWTPAVSGQVVIETCGSSLDTALAVYLGESVDALTLLIANNDGCGTGSRVTFPATAGTPYRIAVDGAASWNTGAFTLTLRTPNLPANDGLSAATELAGVLPLHAWGHNVDATREAGEPVHATGGSASVWWRWTPALSDVAVVELCGSPFDTLLGVYTGTAVDALTPVASDDDGCGPGAGSRVRFPAVAGTTYWIAVDGWDGASGLIALELRLAPANDDLAAAAVIGSALPAQAVGTVLDATAQPGEPDHADLPAWRSVWFSWTAPTSELVAIETCGSAFDTRLAVYTGAAVDALSPVVANDDASCAYDGESRVHLAATAGTTYLIAVDSAYDETGTVALTIRPATPPANDHLAGAQALEGPLPLSAQGSNAEATVDPGEPGHATVANWASVWWAWTPDVSGTVVVETCGTDFDTLLGVYTGTAVDALTPVASNDDGCGLASRVTFAAAAGTTYRIAVDGVFGDTGPISLALRVHQPPANDAFADAERLAPGLPVSASGSNVDASEQVGEPGHGGGASVWYRWTPAVSGPVVISTCGSDFETLLGVYTGTVVNGLTAVAASPGGVDCEEYGRGTLAFTTTALTTYSIAVDGSGAQAGNLVLAIRSASPPANDDVANAQVLDGRRDRLPTNARGTTFDATRQAGEPGHGIFGGTGSVWFRWTPDASGPVVAETCGSEVPALLEVYTGAGLHDLQPVVAPDARCGPDARVAFTAQAGRTYHFAVEARAEQGPFRLRLRVPVPPANDAFAAAQVLEGALPLRVEGSNVDAGKETSEWDHGLTSGGASVWYLWTAPATGRVVVDSCASRFEATLGVYVAEAVYPLTEIATGTLGCPDGRIGVATFTALAGQTYRIAVDGALGDAGRLVLELRAAPAHDDIAQAQVLDGALPIQVQARNAHATTQSGEPAHAGRDGGASLWYRWTPATTGSVRIDTCGGPLDTLLAVYTGGALNRLTPVAANDDACGSGSTVTFTATAGQTYLIAVDAADGATGNVRLRIRR